MSDYDPQDLEQQESLDVSKKTKAKLELENEESDLKWLMSSKRGRRIVWRLLGQAGVFQSSFNTNAMLMAFAEGNRNFGQRTLGLIHTHCPELYPVMVKEQANGRSADATDATTN